MLPNNQPLNQFLIVIFYQINLLFSIGYVRFNGLCIYTFVLWIYNNIWMLKYLENSDCSFLIVLIS